MTDTIVQVPVSAEQKTDFKRYFQFGLLLLAAGAIYPLLYLRQNFETSILEAFQITTGDLGNYYSMLGVMYFVCYVPSGWLADRLSPRLLVTFSMVATGALGLWFASIPSKDVLVYIFMAWGIAAGLTFWASMLKGVKMLAQKNEQGRFFGILDGGRGLVEAVLATIAISIFAYAVESNGLSNTLALKQVIYMYSFTCIGIGVLTFLFFRDGKAVEADSGSKGSGNLVRDLKFLMSIPELWMVALIIFCGYQLFWATYSFSAFMQESYQVTAVTAGFITVAKLWMRPIGGIGAGILGDRYGKENILAIALLGATLGLVFLILFPQLSSVYLLLAIVLLIGVLTYAIRGLYWAILDGCNLPMQVTGLAIGVISLIAYTPDIFLPQINAYIAARYEGITVYNLYFGYIAVMGMIGTLATLKLKTMTAKKRAS
ncbi:MFS transporter [Marinobacterium rhizophilum]|uniref:MFS transporter n=1 Tax=Marinobacterium rhizophilum TaxID=420402 RepID=A0ABY5HIU1_9GAMM|nr:MFS transporter [Marinobacterium rhizophilum]UTW11864.1 MFS transporter [Marinobacterium rhizophilum]